MPTIETLTLWHRLREAGWSYQKIANEFNYASGGSIRYYLRTYYQVAPRCKDCSILLDDVNQEYCEDCVERRLHGRVPIIDVREGCEFGSLQSTIR